MNTALLKVSIVNSVLPGLGQLVRTHTFHEPPYGAEVSPNLGLSGLTYWFIAYDFRSNMFKLKNVLDHQRPAFGSRLWASMGFSTSTDPMDLDMGDAIVAYKEPALSNYILHADAKDLCRICLLAQTKAQLLTTVHEYENGYKAKLTILKEVIIPVFCADTTGEKGGGLVPIWEISSNLGPDPSLDLHEVVFASLGEGSLAKLFRMLSFHCTQTKFIVNRIKYSVIQNAEIPTPVVAFNNRYSNGRELFNNQYNSPHTPITPRTETVIKGLIRVEDNV